MSHLPKVFVIGFNKTATTTIHNFFKQNGYNSVHFKVDDDRCLAPVIVTNVLSGRPVLETIDHFDVYSDMNYADGKLYLEANYFFEDLYNAYPTAYFLLNTRDTDSWIRSRKRHVGRKFKEHGTFHQRISKAYGVSRTETEECWRTYQTAFHERVADFFRGRTDARFLVFDIDNDSSGALIDWVKPHYSLDPALWAAKRDRSKPKSRASRLAKRIRTKLNLSR